MRVQLKKDKVVAGSVWLIDSVVDVPDEEAKKLIDNHEAVAVEDPPRQVIFAASDPAPVFHARHSRAKKKADE